MYRRACSTCSIRSTRPGDRALGDVGRRRVERRGSRDADRPRRCRRNGATSCGSSSSIRTCAACRRTGNASRGSRWARFAPTSRARCDAGRPGIRRRDARGERGVRRAVARPRCPLARRRDQEIHHPAVGRIALEYSAFAVSGRPDQTLVIFTPETAADRALVRSLVAARASWPSRCPSHDGARFIRRMCRHAVSPVAPSRRPSAPSHSALIPSRIFNFHLA